MGSPVSAVIANIFMEDFEERAIASAIHKPKIWKRYVDDTFTILDRDQVDGFLQHLNNQQPHYSFYHGNRERQQHSLSRYVNYKGLKRPSYYQCVK